MVLSTLNGSLVRVKVSRRKHPNETQPNACIGIRDHKGVFGWKEKEGKEGEEFGEMRDPLFR